MFGLSFEQIYALTGLVLGGALIATAMVTYREWTAHKYEGRYSHVYVGEKWVQVYVRDVCTHCGATKERDDTPRIEERIHCAARALTSDPESPNA